MSMDSLMEIGAEKHLPSKRKTLWHHGTWNIIGHLKQVHTEFFIAMVAKSLLGLCCFIIYLLLHLFVCL
jgi:hypothetical protein